MNTLSEENSSPLGTLVTTFHVQPLRWRDLGTTFLPLIVLVISPLGYGLWRTYYGYTNFGPAPARTWGRTYFFVSAFLVLGLLLYTLRRLIRAHRKVKVHTLGLKAHLPPGRQVTLRWEEIYQISSSSSQRSFLGLKSRPRHRLVLRGANGKQLTLDHRIRGLPDLIQIVKEQVHPLLLPQLKTAFHQGKLLDFGRLSLARKGLAIEDKILPWSYIKGIKAQEGFLKIILSPQKQIEIPLQDLYNLELLVKLLKEEI